jgi:hypothetical protein
MGGIFMRISFTKQKGPLKVAVIKETTARDARFAMRNAGIAGADAFDLHLSMLSPEERDTDQLRALFSAQTLPVMALHYNQGPDNLKLTDSDETRMELLHLAATCGASCVDMQGYTFNPGDTRASLTGSGLPFASDMPAEVALRRETIDRQKEFIREIHKGGREVLLSVHTGVFLDCEKVLSLADFLMERDSDALKLVGMCDTPEQLAEYVKAVPALKARFPGKAMHYHCNGKYGTFTRLVGPLLGSYLVFCVERFNVLSIPEQLPLRETAEIYRLIERL